MGSFSMTVTQLDPLHPLMEATGRLPLSPGPGDYVFFFSKNSLLREDALSGDTAVETGKQLGKGAGIG